MAKSGFGTECALVSAEVAESMTKKDSVFARMGVPKITRTLMRGYLPMIGVMAHWVVMLGFMVLAWILFDIAPGFAGLVWMVRRGARNTGAQQNDLLFKNTEDLQLGIENEAGKNNGRIGEVTAPMPVPGMTPVPATD